MNAAHHPLRPDSVAAQRAELWDAGYRPLAVYGHDVQRIPAKDRGKRPKGDGWELRARRDPPEAAEAPAELDALNTGILCDGLRPLDLDVDDAPTVAKLRALAVATLGDAPTRFRDNSPRCLLLYAAAEGEPPKRVLPGKLGKVEVLGRGQQFVGFGFHPSGAVLRWAPEAPTTFARDTLPTVTEAQVTAFLTAAAGIIGAAEKATRDAAGAGLFGHMPSAHGPSADPLDVAAALAVLPNQEPPDWEWWNKVGMATWAATGGSLAGLAAWLAWSERNPAHDPAQCEERWKHYPSAPPTGIGAGTLFHLAREARPGWSKPTGSAAQPAETNPTPQMSILSRTRTPAPELPLGLLGPWWAPWIERAAAGANAPPDYVALPLLTVASALIGNARWARGWQGWFEPPTLWCASVGNPSSGKSPGAAPVMREALSIVERGMARGYPDELAAWKEASKVAEAIAAQWEKDVAKAVKQGGAIPPKPNEATVSPAPVRPRAHVADCTVEKLATLLQGLPKGLLHVRDELAGWLLNLSRYSGGTDRPLWLEAYVGGAYTVDRQKHPEPIYIPRLAVPVFGTIQPDRLADVLTDADDGLAGRFLWAWPDPRPFRRPTQSADIPAAVEALGRLAALAMVEDEAGELQPAFVSLDPAAADMLERFGLEMQDREEAAFGLLRSSIGKARGQAMRLALVLEYLWWSTRGGAEPPSISVAAMEAATVLLRSYFLRMAERVLGDASVPTEERNARTLAKWIAETRPATVNVSAIRDGARLDGLRTSDAVKEACRYLADARWLLAPERPIGGQGGRPRGDWIVNPTLWELLP